MSFTILKTMENPGHKMHHLIFLQPHFIIELYLSSRKQHHEV